MRTKSQRKQEGALRNTRQSTQMTGNITRSMNMNKIDKIESGSPMHLLQLSYQETLDTMMKAINGFYSIIESLQERVRELEMQADNNRKY